MHEFLVVPATRVKCFLLIHCVQIRRGRRECVGALRLQLYRANFPDSLRFAQIIFKRQRDYALSASSGPDVVLDDGDSQIRVIKN
jgi:hypothetical protein